MARGKFNLKKQALAQSIRFDIPNVPFGVGHCVYKLYYGEKYIINTGENLPGSLYFLQNGYTHHVASKQKEADDRKNKLFIAFYRHIQGHPGLEFKLQVLFKSDNAYQVLKQAQIALNEAISDKKCLNSNLQPYTPIWRPKLKKYGGWISQSQMLNFKKFQKNLG